MIKRNELKHNFLKRIFFRVDYIGILDDDIQKIVTTLRNNIFKNGFTSFQQTYENQMNLEFNIDLSSQDVDAKRNDLERLNFYTFFNEKGESISLTKNYFFLNVDVNDESHTFDKYVDILGEIIDCYNKISNYSKPVQIGIQKINVCYFRDLSKLNNYFSNIAFNHEEIMRIYKEYNCSHNTLLTELTKDFYIINYNRYVQEGQMTGTNGDSFVSYQVVLDCIVHCDNVNEIQKALSDRISCANFVKKLNDIEFNLYINSLADKFIELLKGDTFYNNEIEGVN